MPDYTDTNLSSTVYNVLTKARYNALANDSQINEDELYFITDKNDGALILPYNYTDVGGETIEDLIEEALSSDTPVFVNIPASYFPNNEHGAILPLVYYDGHDYFEFGGMVDNQSIYTDYEYNDYWGSVQTKTFSNHVSSANTNSKLYLMGATTQVSNPPSMGSNTNVYATNGVLNAKSFSVDASANIVYNSSSKSIDFTFV